MTRDEGQWKLPPISFCGFLMQENNDDKDKDDPSEKKDNFQ